MEVVVFILNFQTAYKRRILIRGTIRSNKWILCNCKNCRIKLCEALNLQYGFDSISLMPTNLYGPGDNYKSDESHVMAALIKKFSDAKRINSPSVTCWGTGSLEIFACWWS